MGTMVDFVYKIELAVDISQIVIISVVIGRGSLLFSMSVTR